MGERHLYRGVNDYQGSIDESGNLYDERHNLVGRIEGNDVYDFCNIKQGTVDDAGKLWDASHGYVGTSYGDNFIGPTYRDTGMVRGDSIGNGAGFEYGALMMLKKRNRRYSGEIVDGDYRFGDGSDCEENDDDGDVEDESWDDVDDGCESDEDYHHWRDDGRKGRKGCGSRAANREKATGCGEVLGGCISIIFAIILLSQLVRACWKGEIVF
ncbi:MAG: hypothetical protein E7046_01315 [Lentisphaerae bacterium]|nr:hypothetical protein [Lentisphaerota bacterium]